MNLEKYWGKTVRIVDINVEVWEGKVTGIDYAFNYDDIEYDELELKIGNRIIAFPENHIKSIELINQGAKKNLGPQKNHYYMLNDLPHRAMIIKVNEWGKEFYFDIPSKKWHPIKIMINYLWPYSDTFNMYDEMEEAEALKIVQSFINVPWSFEKTDKGQKSQGYSQVILKMLADGVNGNVDSYYNYFSDLTAKLGEEEEFAEGWLRENEELYDLINDEDMYYFYVEEDTRDRKMCQAFLKPYYEEAKRIMEKYD